jgi:hypothetical protein
MGSCFPLWVGQSFPPDGVLLHDRLRSWNVFIFILDDKLIAMLLARGVWNRRLLEVRGDC